MREPPGRTMSCFARTGWYTLLAKADGTVKKVPTLSNDNTPPELDAKQMLRLVEIRVRQRAPDDLVDAREDDVVQGGEGDEEFGEGVFVSDIPDVAGDG